MGMLFLSVLLLREQAALAETRAALANSPQELATAIAEVKRSAFTRDLIPAMAVQFVKASLLAAPFAIDRCESRMGSSILLVMIIQPTPSDRRMPVKMKGRAEGRMILRTRVASGKYPIVTGLEHDDVRLRQRRGACEVAGGPPPGDPQ